MIKKLFMEEKSKIKEDLFGIKVNSEILRGEIYNFQDEFKIKFPIMRKNKFENKPFNKEVKKYIEKLIINEFNDIYDLLTSVNYKITISIKKDFLNYYFKFCFFYKNKNIVFNIIENKNEFKYVYSNNEFCLKDLKHIILMNLFNINSLTSFNRNIIIDNHIKKEDIHLIEILLI